MTVLLFTGIGSGKQSIQSKTQPPPATGMKRIPIKPNTNKSPLKGWTLGLAALGLVSLGAPAPAAEPGTNAPPAAAAQPYGKKADKGFFKRLNEAYAEQNGTAVYTAPKPGDPPPTPRRIGPQPFDGPPFPTGDWQIGGGPNVIGDPGALRDNPYPLMQAIYDGPGGKAWYDSRIQLYGWETISGNLSTSRNTAKGQAANFPEIYDERPNRVEQEQFVLYLERMADESQTDHVDWGFRFAGVYGLDYRFMSTRGFLSNQLYGNNVSSQTTANPVIRNNYYGYDLPMMYANVYIPWVAQGMNIILGRIISEPDIEQQLAPNNLMASHSILYGFDNYTMWGLWTTTKLNANWTVQAGIADGVDIAPWQNDVGRQVTGSLMIQWISSGGHDSWYAGMNSLNNGNFGYNNLQESIASYTHKFNEKWWTTFEGQFMYTKNASTAPTYQVPYQDGFFPSHGGFVSEGGILNYTMRRLADNAFLTIRNEWYDDPAGARTGASTSYYEGSVGITWWANKLLVLRPEIRFEHSFQQPSFDNYTRKSQVTLATDVTYHF